MIIGQKRSSLAVTDQQLRTNGVFLRYVEKGHTGEDQAEGGSQQSITELD